MQKIQNYRDLVVWQRAHALVLDIYKLTAQFPSDERYGLTSQIRRAAASVPTNIVEGFGRWSDSEKVRFYNISQASLKETHYQLLLAHDLNYGNTTQLRNQAEEVEKLLSGLIRSTLSPKQHS